MNKTYTLLDYPAHKEYENLCYYYYIAAQIKILAVPTV